MAADVDKMSEEDIRAMVLVPKLIERGWKAISQIKTEYKITDGEIKFVGKKAVRSRKCQRIDILLRKDMSTHLAVIEVKRNDKAVGFGLQQAMDYAKKINVPLAYSSNGDGFVEYNFISGVQRDLSLDGFPTRSLINTKPRSQKYFATVRRLTIPECFKQRSSLI